MLRLALERPAGALIVESAFTSIPDMARAAYPFLPPVGPLIRTRYETLAKVPRLSLPLLVLHGERDEIVPLAQGRRVFEAADAGPSASSSSRVPATTTPTLPVARPTGARCASSSRRCQRKR